MERGEENQVRQRERESPFRATTKLLSVVSPPLSRRCLGGSATWLNLGMSLPCRVPTIFLPQFIANLSPKPQAPIPKPPLLTHFSVFISISVWVSAFMFVVQSGFRAVFVFGMGLGVCVCVLAWISGWVSGFVCVSG